MRIWKTLTTTNGNSPAGLIIKRMYNVPHMSDKMIADVVTGKKWAPEFIKQLATKEGMKRSLKL